MEGIVPSFGRNEFRNDNCDGFIWLTIINDFLEIFKQRLNKESERRIEDDQACSLSPCLPLPLDLLGFRRVDGNMDSRHIIRKESCIAQGFQRSLMDAADRHHHAVTCLPSR